VIKVYDGDTITIASRLSFQNSPIYKFPVRLLGIDCPEIKGSTENEKALAKTARDALASKINGKTVTLKNVSTEKYGRLLADVYLDIENINQWMLNNNYAVKYDGGTKSRPDNWT
jgi:endonuclease YncB( thermonuclease family)